MGKRDVATPFLALVRTCKAATIFLNLEILGKSEMEAVFCSFLKEYFAGAVVNDSIVNRDS